MNSRFEVEGAAFEEGSSGGDNRSGFFVHQKLEKIVVFCLERNTIFLRFLMALSLQKNWLCGKRQRERIYKFVWMEEASQCTFPGLALREGPNWNGWRKII